MARKPSAKQRAEKDLNNTWLMRYWRPLAAIVYLAICIFDFIIAPTWVGMRTPSVAELALAASGLDPQVGAVLVAPKAQWQPLTLMGGGLVHVAFGAIVGVSAWTRGAEKIEELRQNAFTGYDSTFPQGPGPYPYSYPYQSQYQPYPGPSYQGMMPPGQMNNQQYPMSNEPVDNPDMT